eukprot:NODE_537_length_6324_cov_1.677430.p8 type:complete len:119 gc:universal NODE_537_length_6324_cov_1.677430:1453-1809(+)
MSTLLNCTFFLGDLIFPNGPSEEDEFSSSDDVDLCTISSFSLSEFDSNSVNCGNLRLLGALESTVLVVDDILTKESVEIKLAPALPLLEFRYSLFKRVNTLAFFGSKLFPFLGSTTNG